MPKLTNGKVPRMRLHKASGRAVVTLNGKDVPLGRWGSPDAEMRYNEEIARWLANGRKLAAKAAEAKTVEQLCKEWIGHAETYYVKDGEPTSEVGMLESACREFRKLYGSVDVRKVTSTELMTLQKHLVLLGKYKRRTINAYVGRVVRMFRWAVLMKYVDIGTYQELKSVPPLKKDRCAAAESVPVGPAPEASIKAIVEGGSPKLAAMIEVQRLTGMRPGELLAMLPGEVDRSGAVWIYVPDKHKTEHHGKTRVVTIGPKAQAVLGPWIDRAGGNRVWRSRNGQPIDTRYYRTLVSRACEKAGVDVFHPHQLRHSMATDVLESLMEAALRSVQSSLGHADSKTSKIYADISAKIAAEVAAAFG